jgi:hypothetical protein
MLRTLVVREPGVVLQIDDVSGIVSTTGDSNAPPYAAGIPANINTPNVSGGNTTSTALVAGNLPVATAATAQDDSGIAASNVVLLSMTALHTVASGATPAFNFAPTGNGLRQKNVMTSNIAPTFSGSSAGDEVSLELIQDGTGGRTVTWPGNVSTQTPNPSAPANSKTLFKWMYDGSEYVLIAAVGGQ